MGISIDKNTPFKVVIFVCLIFILIACITAIVPKLLDRLFDDGAVVKTQVALAMTQTAFFPSSTPIIITATPIPLSPTTLISNTPNLPTQTPLPSDTATSTSYLPASETALAHNLIALAATGTEVEKVQIDVANTQIAFNMTQNAPTATSTYTARPTQTSVPLPSMTFTAIPTIVQIAAVPSAFPTFAPTSTSTSVCEGTITGRAGYTTLSIVRILPTDESLSTIDVGKKVIALQKAAGGFSLFYQIEDFDTNRIIGWVPTENVTLPPECPIKVGN